MENLKGKWIGLYLVTHSNGKMLKPDTGDQIIYASIDKVKKHYTRFEYFANNTNDDNNKDESAGNIISRLLSTTPQTVSADAIGTN